MAVNTKPKILKVAAREFAENGYRKTTVRTICQKAGVNVAAVNYHFSGKAELYKQTVDWLIDSSGPDDAELFLDGNSIEENIRSWVSCCIRERTANKNWYWEMALKIVYHEMQGPSENYDHIYKTRMEPDLKKLEEYISTGYENKLSRTELKLKVFSLVGRTLFFIFHINMIKRYGGSDFMEKERDNVINNVVFETVKGFSCK